MNDEVTKKDQGESINLVRQFIKRNRTSIQALALLLALLMPFLLYDALQKGDYILALIAFSLIGFSMLLVILV